MAFSGGAPAVVSQVMTLVSQLANERNTSLVNAVNLAIAAATKASKTAGVQPLGINDVPSTFGYAVSDNYKFPISQLETVYGEKVAKVATDMAASFAGLLSQHFPTMSSYVDAANSWMTDALVNGGSGVNSTVEAQLWERERARILREERRAADEVVSSWAGRGFPLPAGAMVHQLSTLSATAQIEISESSRAQAIKSWDAELANVRAAVDKALEVRTTAHNAALEYMKAVATAPQTGLALTQNVQATHARLVETLASLYKLDLEGTGFNLGMRVKANDYVREKENVDLKSINDTLDLRIKAMTAGAQAQGTQAAAALNGLHAQGSVSGSDVTTTSIQG